MGTYRSEYYAFPQRLEFEADSLEEAIDVAKETNSLSVGIIVISKENESGEWESVKEIYV